MIQDHQLIPSLKLNLFWIVPFPMQKKSMIHAMGPQGFLLGISNRVTRVHMHEYESFSPIHYTMIKYTWNKSSGGYVYIKIKKIMYGLKQAVVWALKNLVNNLSPHGYTFANTLQSSGGIKLRKNMSLSLSFWCQMIFRYWH